MLVVVEDGFLVRVKPSRRLNLESLCDPAGSLDRFTRASTYGDLSTCIRVLLRDGVSFASQENVEIT